MAEFVILEKDQPCYDYAAAHPGDYELPEDSYPQKGYPQGKLIKRRLIIPLFTQELIGNIGYTCHIGMNRNQKQHLWYSWMVRMNTLSVRMPP